MDQEDRELSCLDCGFQFEEKDTCPECGSSNIIIMDNDEDLKELVF